MELAAAAADACELELLCNHGLMHTRQQPAQILSSVVLNMSLSQSHIARYFGSVSAAGVCRCVQHCQALPEFATITII